jgi:hypothetical protein
VIATYADEQRAIMGRLAALWVDGSNVPLTPIAWPNAAFTPPPNAPYIEPRVTRQIAFNSDIGTPNKRVRHPGLLTVNIRTPLNRGDNEALTLADTVAGIFRNLSVDWLVFRAPTVRDQGRDGSYYWVQVDCPYHRDSILAASGTSGFGAGFDGGFG